MALKASYPGGMGRCDAAVGDAITVCLTGSRVVSISEDTCMRRDRDSGSIERMKGTKLKKGMGYSA
jgi:hypothetical protein